MLRAGVGLGWRPETAWLIDCRARLGLSEVIAEIIDPRRPPPALMAAVARGLPVVTHGVGLSLGGAGKVERARVRKLAEVARTLRSPLVSEHVAFCRAGGLESPHFLPVPHTRAQLAVLVDNVRRVIDSLAVPFALENIAAPLRWPAAHLDELGRGAMLDEADFLAELVDRTGALLLLDVANLHGDLVNHGGELDAYLARLPLERVAYLHVAGGARVDAMWRDTHAHPIASPILDTLRAVLARTGPRPILLERDHHFGTRRDLEAELDQLETVLAAAPSATPSRAPRPLAALPHLDRTLRRELEGDQRALLHAVLANGEVPAGFEPPHIAETRAILTGKQLAAKARRLTHARVPSHS